VASFLLIAYARPTSAGLGGRAPRQGGAKVFAIPYLQPSTFVDRQ